MKILYIHQYFKSPTEGGSTRSYYLAKGLVDNGYEVEMITGYNGTKPLNENIDGITVHYLPVYYDNHLGFFQRVISFLKFIYKANKLALRIQGIDLVYAMTTPLTVGLLALNIKRKRKIPFYLEVGDLWPEAPVQMGIIRNPVIKLLVYQLERKIYQESEKIIALSSGIRNYIEKIVPGKKVYVIPNMSDVDFFKPSDSTREHLGKFVISYFGAAGKANHLEYLLEVASLCQNHLPQVYFRIMAYGSELKRLQHLAVQTSIDNLKFIPYGSKVDVKALLHASDAVYVSFANYDVLNTGSPNKFFDGLAAGKLMIINFEGWLKDIIEAHQCGFTYNPEYPEEFIEQLSLFLSDKELLIKSQNNSRDIAEKYYSKELQIKKLLKLLNNEHHLSISDSEVYILTA
ncbi:MAG: glycosyltransferase family 4 protein [Bacteroidetes bacterium]|nr:glycosyltransferase family 4 protein [Bacteroidota bacterium]MDA1122567.1 glycosyltransferase family 4 protein [Bacteroidota bacterium]